MKPLKNNSGRLALVEIVVAGHFEAPSLLAPMAIIGDGGLKIYSDSDANDCSTSDFLDQRDGPTLTIDELVRGALQNGGYDLGDLVRTLTQIEKAATAVKKEIAAWEDGDA